MAKSSGLTTMVFIAVLVSYFFVPGFKGSVNEMFNGMSGSSVGDVSMEQICVLEKITIAFDNPRPGSVLYVNKERWREILPMEEFDVRPGMAIELMTSSESGAYWADFAPCQPQWIITIQDTESESINITTPEQDILETDYGIGGYTLPDLTDTEYDFEDTSDLDLEI